MFAGWTPQEADSERMSLGNRLGTNTSGRRGKEAELVRGGVELCSAVPVKASFDSNGKI